MTGTDKRKALGRGLGALIPPAAPPAPAQAASAPTIKRDYFVVGIEEVHPSGQNPRQIFDDKLLNELADSIRQQGLIQPLVVRTRSAAEGGGFAIIAGERRWRASQRAGLKQVPVVVKEATPKEAFELALVENLQREDLNPMEEAEGYRRMCDEYGYTQDQLAERVGKARETITNTLRLLKLPTPVRSMLAVGQLQVGHAKALLALEDEAKVAQAASRVAERGLTVRQTEELVRRERETRPARTGRAEKARSAAVRDVESRLARALGTKVRLVEKDEKSGRIEIDYSSLDELDRLLDLLRA